MGAVMEIMVMMEMIMATREMVEMITKITERLGDKGGVWD